MARRGLAGTVDVCDPKAFLFQEEGGLVFHSLVLHEWDSLPCSKGKAVKIVCEIFLNGEVAFTYFISE